MTLKLPPIILTCSLFFAALATPSGAYGATAFDYIISGDVITITGCSSTCPSNLSIPDEIDGRTVRTIADGAFAGQSLVSVKLPWLTTQIGSWAFANNYLSSLKMPSALQGVGVGAFSNNSLSSINFRNGLVSIGDYAFYDNAITSVTLPDSTQSIGEFAFYQNAISQLWLGNSIETIGRGAFGSNGITTIELPDTLTGISEGAFASNKLSALVIPNSMISIGKNAFHGNVLRALRIGNQVTSIGEGAFSFNALSNLSIPSSVTSIGVDAFSDNELGNVTFLGNAPESAGQVFSSNPGLAAVSRYASATGWAALWGSVPVQIIPERATAVVKPSVLGTLRVGRTITAVKGTWTGYPAPTFTYQWYSCSSAIAVARTSVPSTCKKISGATRSTFKVTSAQRGKYIAVLIKGASAGTAASVWLSKALARVR